MKKTICAFIIGIDILLPLSAQETIRPMPEFDRTSLEGVVLPAKSYIRVDPLDYFPKHDIVFHFTLRAQRGFMVSSEKEAGKDPSHVLVYSALGSTCRMVNPWGAEKLVLVDADTGKKIKYNFEKGILTFSTMKGRSYLIYPAGQKPERKVFTAGRNEGPKYFHEAVLGRPRDY